VEQLLVSPLFGRLLAAKIAGTNTSLFQTFVNDSSGKRVICTMAKDRAKIGVFK